MDEPELQEKSFKRTVEPTSLSKHEWNAGSWWILSNVERNLAELVSTLKGKIFLKDYIRDGSDGTPAAQAVTQTYKEQILSTFKIQKTKINFS